jgi:hypothetical protein
LTIKYTFFKKVNSFSKILRNKATKKAKNSKKDTQFYNSEVQIMKIYNKRKVLCAFLTALVLIFLSNGISAQNMFRKIRDFDGDGKTDFAIVRNENGLKVWYTQQSTAGYGVFQWGLATDQIAHGDYDGDGRTDYTVFRLTAGANSTTYQSFYIYQSSTNSLDVQTFTIQGTLPPNFIITPYLQDYDGDGKTDPSILYSTPFSSGSFIVSESLNHQIRSFTIPSGNYGVPLGDLTGDGKADLFSFNPNNYNVSITNYDNGSVKTQHFGATGDQFVPGDFDGDGTGDLTVFRESNGSWWTMRSSDGTVQVVNWGQSGDISVAGDYDGDGKTDVAIWRKGSPQSYYWVYGSQNGVQVLPFGNSNDLPVRY